MGNTLYENVLKTLINEGISPDFAVMFLKKGMKEVSVTEDTVNETKMGFVLQQHVFKAIQMFFLKDKAQRVIHKCTLKM